MKTVFDREPKKRVPPLEAWLCGFVQIELISTKHITRTIGRELKVVFDSS